MTSILQYGTSYRYLTKDQILEHLKEKDEKQFDKTIKSCQIQAEELDEHLLIGVNADGKRSTLSLSNLAHSQLLGRLGIPVAFFDRNPAERQADMLDYGAAKYDRGLLLRHVQAGDRAFVRAVLSDNYGIMDDISIFPTVIEALETTDQNVEYRTFTYDDRITQLVAVFPDTRTQYGSNTVQAGVMITNSEIGQSSVWIEPVVLWGSMQCVGRNYLQAQSLEMRIVHRGKINKQRIANMATQMKEIAQVGIVQMAEAWEQRISGQHALRFAKGIDALPKRIYDILEEQWSELQEVSKAAVTMRIMALAKSLPLFQRARIEQEACMVTGVFNNYRARMDQILAEVE